MNTTQTVQKLLPIARALVLRAGARHSQADNTDIQAMHDLACKLGAKCKTISDGTRTQFSAEAMKAELYDELILRHPGHPNQKTHGNRFGAGQAKESLRRLKDDKGAREKYKESARGRGQGSGGGSSKTSTGEIDKRDLGTRSKQQRKKDIEELSNLPLKELRRRQDLVKDQQTSAYEQYKKAKDPAVRERLDRGMSNLQQMDDDLMAAVDLSLDKGGQEGKSVKEVFSPVSILNRQRASAVEYAKMQQARGDKQGVDEMLKEIEAIEEKIGKLGGKIKFT